MRIPQPTTPGLTSTRRYRTLALAAAALLADCTAYEAAEAPSPAIPAMPYSVKEGALSFGADPHVEAERQEAVFAADFASLSIVPVHVVIGNSGGRPVRIGPDQFMLALPGSEATAPRPGSEIALMFPPERGVAHYATSGVSILGGLAGPIGALAGRVAGMLGALMLSQHDGEAAEGRRDDYARKELPSVQLERGKFARGFLFFVLPRGIPAFEEAMLTFSPPAETGLPGLQLMLKGLHVKGLPASTHPSPFH